MKKTSTQKKLLPDDVLTRFLFYKKEFNENTHSIKTSLLSKKHPKGFSVFEITNSSHDDVWQTGKDHAAPNFEKQGRPILGRFDIESKYYTEAGLSIELVEPPPRHYNILGMPIPSAAKGKEVAHRQIIVNNSKLHLIMDNSDWTKYGTINS